MPIPACCIKEKFYAKSALHMLYSKGDLYANDVGIKLPHVYDLAYSIEGEILCSNPSPPPPKLWSPGLSTAPHLVPPGKP